MTEQQERIQKAINFFRKFNAKSDSVVYQKSVLRFCDLVEAELQMPDEFVEVVERKMF